MATKKKTPTKTAARKVRTPKAQSKSAPTPAAMKANRAERAEFEAFSGRSSGAPQAASIGPTPPGASPGSHPYAGAVPYPGGHPMFGWSAPWGPPPGMPWPAPTPVAAPGPGGEYAEGGSLLANLGTMIRLGADLLNAGLQGGTQMMYGMSGAGLAGPHGLEHHGHHWPGHGCDCDAHHDCWTNCAGYVDCCCCYGCRECQPGIHNCP